MGDTTTTDCFSKLDRKFDHELTQDEVRELTNEDFLQYLREQTWSSICSGLGVKWEDLSIWDRLAIDCETLLRVALVIHKVCSEEES